jgi:hypothetical protein
MSKYLLKRYENGNEVTVAEGSDLSGMKSIVNNSPSLFKNGYAIYEMKLVEYGVYD